MRILLSSFLALCIGIFAPQMAIADGAGTFSANCAACHAAGGNLVNPERTLSQADLKSFLANYESDHEAAIVAQVTNGKNAMPSFNGVLTASEISEVAAYVESQSSKGWG
ncbi:c-type cytochrome [Prochlorococcus sp. MIT 1341]|uniref:c-type cytochrome n=1 Tax=Prochlorococcus sp. MIT 1341 TaxID=3096221 RepID=UPI002A766843|nr:c-type cytochrome [Prochlorococcus sp. MIT 1341]